ncbi:MAG TPA: thioredoxin [Lutibacter sp.]|nr:thioredoxin [Lutibacter sp.]
MVLDINNSEFENKVVKSDKLVVVEVYTQRCPHCKRLHPIFDQTASDNAEHINFYKLDAQKNMALAKQYKVLTVPTLLFFSHGILVDKKRGVSSQKQIEKRLLPLMTYTKEKAASKERTGFFKMSWS